jgi:nicotinate-nucleotide adenylyltransferase
MPDLVQPATSAAQPVLRLGVFGGAFDPPHLMHLALVQAAIDQLELDQIRVLPTGQAWHKTRQLESAEHRLAMARLAFGAVAKVVVDDREMRRTGPSYTVDTLRELKNEFPLAKLFLIIGEDQARAFKRWHAWQEVSQSAIIYVAGRACLSGVVAIISSKIGDNPEFESLQVTANAVSATEIRERAANGENLAPLAGQRVARYIAEHLLYQTLPTTDSHSIDH